MYNEAEDGAGKLLNKADLGGKELFAMIARKFGFQEGVYLVKGAKRGAIYDLNRGDVYSISEEAIQVLDSALTGKTPQEVSPTVPELGIEGVVGFLEFLVDMELGEWYQGSTRAVKHYEDLPRPAPKLEHIWLELTHGCNLRCIHCYASSAPEKIGMERMTVEDWKTVIAQLGDLNCRSISFIGGEPLLYRGFRQLVQYAREQGISFLEVFTNATLITEEMAEFLQQSGVSVAFSLYASNAMHDHVTKIPGSFTKTVNNIKLLQSKNIPVRASIVGMSVNQEQVDGAIKFAREDLKIENIRLDLVRPAGRGSSDKLVPSKLIQSIYKTEPSFPQIHKEIFIKRLYGHSCWNGVLAISPSGDVMPCVMARDMILGNVREAPLVKIIGSKEVSQVWGLSKDHIEVCQDCEYRYACFDCRPKAACRTGNLFSKPIECLYNPYTGKWSQFPPDESGVSMGKGRRLVGERCQ